MANERDFNSFTAKVIYAEEKRLHLKTLVLMDKSIEFASKIKQSAHDRKKNSPM